MQYNENKILEIFNMVKSDTSRLSHSESKELKENGFFNGRFYYLPTEKMPFHRIEYYRFLKAIKEHFLSEEFESIDSRILALCLDARSTTVANMVQNTYENINRFTDKSPYTIEYKNMKDKAFMINRTEILLFLSVLHAPTISSNAEKVVTRRKWILKTLLEKLV